MKFSPDSGIQLSLKQKRISNLTYWCWATPSSPTGCGMIALEREISATWSGRTNDAGCLPISFTRRPVDLKNISRTKWSISIKSSKIRHYDPEFSSLLAIKWMPGTMRWGSSPSWTTISRGLILSSWLKMQSPLALLFALTALRKGQGLTSSLRHSITDR